MLAVRSSLADKAPEDRKMMARNVVNTGRAFTPASELKDIRAGLNLPNVTLDDESVAQVKAAVEKAGLLSIIGEVSGGSDKR